MRDLYSPKNDINSIARLIESGADVTDLEILTVLLDGLSEFVTSHDAAQTLLDKFGSICGVCDAPISVLEEVDGVGRRGAQILKACRACLSNLLKCGSSDELRRLYTQEEIVQYLRPNFLNLKVEKLYMLMLNSKYKVLGVSFIAQGDTDKLVFDRKLMLDEIIKHNARCVVLAHNHFTSVLPSADDIMMTGELAELFDRINVKLYDHIIFCENMTKSMRKSGYIKYKDDGLF